jgi:hypothetical protein
MIFFFGEGECKMKEVLQVTGLDDRMAGKRLSVVEYLQFREVTCSSIPSTKTHFSSVSDTSSYGAMLTGVAYASATYSQLL